MYSYFAKFFTIFKLIEIKALYFNRIKLRKNFNWTLYMLEKAVKTQTMDKSNFKGDGNKVFL